MRTVLLCRSRRPGVVSVQLAGEMQTVLTTSADLQDVMVVNYLSPFVFTRTLLPLLEQTAKEPGADVRIVNVSVFLDHGTL